MFCSGPGTRSGSRPRPTSCAGGDRVLIVSSAGVYDQQVERTLTEEDADGGTSLYGAAKLAGELVARRYAQVVGLDFAAVRPSSLFGAGEVERPSRPRVTAFAQLVDAARRGEAVRIEHGESRADGLCVDDAADAVASLWSADRLGGRVFTLSSGRTRRLQEVADEVAAATGLRLDPGADTVVDGGADRGAVLENRRIREALGWRPRRTIAHEARTLLEDRESSTVAGGAR
jgi:nucleoside-diphosphate-sugar epimerase